VTIEFVLDTSALVAYARDEPGSSTIAGILDTHRCLMHAVNVGEFLCAISRRMSERFDPESANLWVEQAGVERSYVLTPAFLVLSARIRRAAPALSFGDGVALALASVSGLPVLTTEKAFRAAADFAAIDLIR